MAEPSMVSLDNFSVVMCKKCKTILAEGRHACECSEILNAIAFLSATTQVVVEDVMRYDVSSDLQGCVYSYLKCKVCSAKIGMLLNSSVAEVAHLRRMFCFFTKSILCYSMKTRKLLEGSWFYVDVSSCVTQIQELEQKTFDVHERVTDMEKKMQHLQSSVAKD